MNTAFYEGPKLIMNKDKIFEMYKQNHMLKDIVALFILFFNIFYDGHEIYIKIICFPIFWKLSSLINNVDILEEKLQLEGDTVYVKELLYLLSLAFFLCHFVGTGYYFVA